MSVCLDFESAQRGEIRYVEADSERGEICYVEADSECREIHYVKIKYDFPGAFSQ